MSDEQKPVPQPAKTCALCAYFRKIKDSQFGNCHGNPPYVERGPTGQVFTGRPQVLPSDAACVLFKPAE
jgi:hypothetical protein